MCKSRFLAIFFGMLLVLSNTSEARVCFLSGSDEFNCSSGMYDDYIKVSKCSGYELCDKPSNNPGKTCEEEDMTHYLPEDCCSNTSLYEPCDSPKVCDGTVCESGTRAPAPKPGMSIRPPKNPWRSYCEIGKCHCPASYTKLCDGNGQIGAFSDGTPDEEGCVGDDGVTRYEACICGDEYAVCDPEATPSTDEDDICTDSNDVTKYRQCTCPNTTAKRPEGNNWVEDPVYCCEGVETECKGHNADNAYLCKGVNEPVAQCGYMMNNGCYGNVKSFEYSTSDVNQWSTVHCEQGWGPDDTTNLYCGTNCTCATGYFDYNTVCTAAGSDICSELGYMEDSCEGDSIACPYDASAKRCISASCLYYTKAHCETSAYKICTKDEYGCWNLTSCAEGYLLLANRCMPNPCVGYKLTSCPEGATCNECKKGATTMYKKTGCETNYWSTEAECEASPWSLDSSRNNEGFCVQPSTNACWRVKTCEEDGYITPSAASIKQYIIDSGGTSQNKYWSFLTGVYHGYLRCIQARTTTSLPGVFYTNFFQAPPSSYDRTLGYEYSGSDFNHFDKVHGQYGRVAINHSGQYLYTTVLDEEDYNSGSSLSGSEILNASSSKLGNLGVPTRLELQDMANHMTGINERLSALGQDQLTFPYSTSCYWGYDYSAKQLYILVKEGSTYSVYGGSSTQTCRLRPVSVYRHGYSCGHRTGAYTYASQGC